MSNIKHPKCALRSLAAEAKARLNNNTYCEPSAPKNATPQQKEIYLKLYAMKKQGEEVFNPIAQLADNKKMASLSHEERQRYILQLSADYISMRNMLDASSKGA